MKTWIALASAASIAPIVGTGSTLTTDYRTGRTIDVEIRTTIETRTTDFRFERDGVEEEPRFGGGGGSLVQRTIAYTDEVLAAEGGRPARIRRAFGDVVRDSSVGRGEDSFDREDESPLEGVTLELARTDGELEVSVVDGPDLDSEQLEGHFLDLTLDALLPPDEVEAGDSWALDDFTIRHALALELDGALFPRDEDAEGGERGGRGRGRGRFGGGRDARLFRDGEWEGEAELVTLAEDDDGRTVARIDLELSTSGELADEGFGRRRDFAPGQPGPPAGTEFEIELDGRLLFDVGSGLPVELDLEGTLTIESLREMDRGGSSIVIESTREGTFHHHVQVTEIAGGDDE